MIKERFRTKKESDIYYYADSTHPTYKARSTYAWIKKGKHLEPPTVSGRDPKSTLTDYLMHMM